MENYLERYHRAVLHNPFTYYSGKKFPDYGRVMSEPAAMCTPRTGAETHMASKIPNTRYIEPHCEVQRRFVAMNWLSIPGGAQLTLRPICAPNPESLSINPLRNSSLPSSCSSSSSSYPPSQLQLLALFPSPMPI